MLVTNFDFRLPCPTQALQTFIFRNVHIGTAFVFRRTETLGKKSEEEAEQVELQMRIGDTVIGNEQDLQVSSTTWFRSSLIAFANNETLPIEVL